MILYSTSESGFYDSEINKTIPSDSVEISAVAYEALMVNQRTKSGAIVFPADGSQPTFAEVESNAMTQLREYRDRLISKTDWRAGQDVPAMSQAWVDYRQALRDITDGADPQISEDGSLINVTMPTPPE
jgi:hypothetical protein|tara:strand:+ start:566 stop:952 length:387 start_codon:yes stop_codon:yes gene_type:complete